MQCDCLISWRPEQGNISASLTMLKAAPHLSMNGFGDSILEFFLKQRSLSFTVYKSMNSGSSGKMINGWVGIYVPKQKLVPVFDLVQFAARRVERKGRALAWCRGEELSRKALEDYSIWESHPDTMILEQSEQQKPSYSGQTLTIPSLSIYIYNYL